MSKIIEINFWSTIFLLFYTYIGYFVLLKIFANSISKKDEEYNNDNFFQPKVSVIIAAYNEEKVIARRIENLLEQDYPKDKMEIIVVSDGSIDRTVEIAKKYENRRVKVLDFKQNRGRAAVHNDAVKVANGDIVIFTDADTEFKKDFISQIIKYFKDNSIGCVVGNLVYKVKQSSISHSEGFYWKFEKKLRKLESNLGLLATATGACMAVRKELWKDLTPIDDSDFTTPLDVIFQGFKVVYAPEAIAYDVPPSSIKGEFKTRVRQTSKNLVGTLRRWGFKGWVKHPFVSWSLLSHKILRWFTPFFMINLFITNLILVHKEGFYQEIFIMQIVFYTLAVCGLIGEIVKIRIPIAQTVFSFCVANIGIAIGVIKGLIGKAPTSYKRVE